MKLREGISLGDSPRILVKSWSALADDSGAVEHTLSVFEGDKTRLP